MTTWQAPEDFPTLNGNRVHVWQANLKLPSEKIEYLKLVLSPDEIARANKFRFAQHRIRFIAARSILRQLLAGYLGTPAQDLCFTYGSKGKPYLDLISASPLQFNLSHSRDFALYGFSDKHLIGVDLEYQRPMPDALKIARRFFSQREYQMLADVEIEKRSLLFFQLWTAKEAYLKAIGTGLADSLASIEIACNPPSALSLAALERDSEATTDWSLFPCTPAKNYTAAIAIQNFKVETNISYWHWQSNLFDSRD